MAETEKARILSDKKKLDRTVCVEIKSAVELVEAKGKVGTYQMPLQTVCSVLGFGMTVVVPMAGRSCVVI